MKYVGTLKSEGMCSRSVCWKLQNTDKRNQRKLKSMKRYTIFMDWKSLWYISFYFCQHIFSLHLGSHYLGIELLGHLVTRYLTFWGSTKPFQSGCTIVKHIPTSSVWGLTSTCCYLVFGRSEGMAPGGSDLHSRDGERPEHVFLCLLVVRASVWKCLCRSSAHF